MEVSLKFYVERARATWEEGYSYFAILLNDVADELKLSPRIAAAPPPAGSSTETVKRRFLNALHGLRPFSLDLPAENESPLWSLGYGEGLGSFPTVVMFGGPFSNDYSVMQAVKSLRESVWNDVDWKENIVDAVESFAKVWRTFFDGVEAEYAGDEITMLGIQDRITFKEMVKLGNLDEDSTRNWSTKDRPNPAIPQRGRQAAVFRYAVIRPWFIKNRQDLAGYWPESYADAMGRLKAL